MCEITIVTPTFNRGNLLLRLYESLTKQTTKRFMWLIIDDGSTDSTKSIVEKFVNERKINIKYYYKENGGKSRALNFAFSIITESRLAIIVDSDDYLLPEAIEIVGNYIKQYKVKDDNIGAFFFNYKTTKGQLIRPKNKFYEPILVDRYCYNKKYGKNDGCVCYFSEVFKNYKYPEHLDENYVGPTVLQMMMAEKYKILFIPEVIGIAEYQKDGLTNLNFSSFYPLRHGNVNISMYIGRLSFTYAPNLGFDLVNKVIIFDVIRLQD